MVALEYLAASGGASDQRFSHSHLGSKHTWKNLWVASTTRTPKPPHPGGCAWQWDLYGIYNNSLQLFAPPACSPNRKAMKSISAVDDR